MYISYIQNFKLVGTWQSLISLLYVLVIYQDSEAGQNTMAGEENYEITEEMRQEMDYNADRAWYIPELSFISNRY